MRRSSLFLDSHRSHKKRKTSSVSSSTTSTWSRYQSALIKLLSWRILILKTCPRSTASMVNLSTWGDKCWCYICFNLAVQDRNAHRWWKMVMKCAFSYTSSLKFVAVCLWLAEFSLPSVPQVPVNCEEDVGVGASTVHITCHHWHFVCVSCSREDVHKQAHRGISLRQTAEYRVKKTKCPLWFGATLITESFRENCLWFPKWCSERWGKETTERQILQILSMQEWAVCERTL